MTIQNTFVRLGLILFWIAVIFAFVNSSRFWSHADRKSINVCAWTGMFDLLWLERFEKETGIHVNLSYYESNEELMVKLQTNKAHGYDLIIPSDYAIRLLRKKNMLKKLAKEKLAFYHALNPLLLHYYFDENNDYSVPCEWSIYGLGINTACYNEQREPTWGLVFKPKLIGHHKIMMTNDPLIALPIVAYYLFGTMDTLTKNDVPALESVLAKQRPFVEAYTDFRASYYLASKNASIAVCSSSSIFRSKREYAHLDFIIPKEGTLLTIENFAIPSTSTKDDLVYVFMNFMMKPESVAHTYEHIGFFPATLDVLDKIALPPEVHELLTMSRKEFERFHLIRYDILNKIMTNFELQDLWIQIKR